MKLSAKQSGKQPGIRGSRRCCQWVGLVLCLSAMLAQGGTDSEPRSDTSISGTLLPDNLASRSVMLFDAAGIAQDFELVDQGSSEWSFDGLEPGSYYIRATGTDPSAPHQSVLHNGRVWVFDGINPASGPPLTVSAGEALTGVDIVLEQGGTVSGSLIDADGSPVPAEPGMGMGSYDLVDEQGNVVGGGEISESGGQLALMPSLGSGTPPGQYYLRTYSRNRGLGVGYGHQGESEGTAPGFADGMYPNVSCAGLECDQDAATPITITAGEFTEVDLQIVPGSTVEGNVVDDDTDQGVPSVVKLVDVDNNVLAAVISDDNGEFSFGAFPAGHYYLRTSVSGNPGPGLFGTQSAYFDTVHGAGNVCSEALCDPGDGQPIQLDGDSDAESIELRVMPGPVIRGEIVDQLSGQTISAGKVDILDHNDDFVGAYHVDPGTGYFQTTALVPGTYSVIPNVSPAFSAVGVDAPDQPEFRNLHPDDLAQADESAFTVVMGDEDVEIIARVVDRSLDRLFQDAFED